MPYESLPRFFVSYHGADRSWAEWIAWVLRADGFSVELQGWDFRPDQDYADLVDRVDRSGRDLLLVVSKTYLLSPYSRDLWASRVLGHGPLARRTVLVRVDHSPVPQFMERHDVIDLSGEGRGGAIAALNHMARRGGSSPDRRAGSASIGRYPASEPRFPANPPDASNLPRRNISFTGRSELIGSVRDFLQASAQPTVVQALHGLGGVGKSQLALEYAHRYAADYDIVWWIEADHAPAIITGFANLGRKLGLPKVASQEEILEMVTRRLDGKRWLLVFDNAEKPSDIERYVPEGGHVLITSRNPSWVGHATPVLVDVLTWTESVAFLAKRVGSAGDENLGELAETLGRLPLALEQAAAYIESTRISVGDYLELYRSHEFSALTLGEPSDYPQTLASTWSLALDRLRDEMSAATDVLELCAVLGADNIPRSMLQISAEFFPGPLRAILSDTILYNSAVSGLVRYSLISAGPRTLGIHRLVQVLVRSRMGARREGDLVRSCLRWLSATFPQEGSDPQDWSRCDELLPHLLVLVQHAERSRLELPVAGMLLGRAGRCMHARVQLADAEAALRHAVRLSNDSTGAGSRQTSYARRDLGRVLQDLGRVTEARAEYTAAVAAERRRRRTDKRHLVELLCDIGRALQEEGNLFQARTELTVALNLAVSANMEAGVTSRIRSSLGRVLQDLGEMREARMQYETALDVTESAYGANDVRAAIRRVNLAGVLQYLGDLELAQSHLERARDLVNTTFGPADPRLVPIRNNIGGVLHDRGLYELALGEFEAAAAICKEAHGAVHPRTVTVRVNLAALLRDMGACSRAEDECRRAMEVDMELFGESHPRVAVDLDCLSTIRLRLGDSTEAIQLARQSLLINAETYGRGHPRTAVVRGHLGVALHAAHQPVAALVELEGALSSTLKAYGNGHTRYLLLRHNHAMVRASQADFAMAINALESVLETGRSKLEEGHPILDVMRNNLAVVRARSVASGAGTEVDPVPLFITLRTYQAPSLLDG
ncbi:FxSxx-COOH system tetratricopeptide repeat protein [Frankia sp. Mgl5]|uniref:FxSxx-COOH system tetratricopeptide repeat protein n=1 Tax=Frankia sp. Mgl5 TaxID=2933793 RepID=UPI00200F293B|nr:FxSxx-COOH system tetratricopeptide repeat protein [Frankia sp. Mgl5]MCK9927768.1 FxSxx-COOH system tetratricopeptide repeat protein [Frankia sp. Mgl5]